MNDYLEQYAESEAHTAKAKRYDLQHFDEFVTARVPSAMLVDATRSMISEFRDERIEMGEAPSTVARRLATVKHFFRRCAEKFPDFADPAREVRAPKIAQARPKWLTDVELASLRRAAAVTGRNEWFQARNHAMIETALSIGLRCFEIAKLTEGQLDRDLTEFHQVHGKGARFDTLPVPPELQPVLREWMDWRLEALMQVDSRYLKLTPAQRGRYPLFISLWETLPGNPFSYRLDEKTIWRVFREAGDVAGIDGMHPHRARHTFIDRFLARTNDLVATQRAARHESVNTTTIYAQPHAAVMRKGYGFED